MEENLAKRIKNKRQEAGFNQGVLASKVGVSKMTVSRWERGERTPDAKELKKLAELLETSTDYLLNGKEEGKTSLEQLFQGLAEKMYSSLPPRNVNDINKEEKIKDPLTGAEIPPINSPEYSDLIYWGRVVENAKLAAKLGTEQEKTDVLMMLNMAVNAFSKLPQKTSPQNIGVQQNNFNGDNNYSGDIPQNATTQ